MTTVPRSDGARRALLASATAASLLGVCVAAACTSTGAATPVDARGTTTAAASATGPAVYGPDHVGLELPGEEVCRLSPEAATPVPPGSYQALLRNARCEQQKFATMARLALTLGVECRHCHAVDPRDGSKEVYPVDTANKGKAVWMYQTFVQGLRLVDGSPTLCASCHLDPVTRQPVAKILGDPRDPVRTMEWMHEMTARFVTRAGERLRCRTCHQGMAPGRDGWLPNMVGEAWLRDALAAPAGAGSAATVEAAGGAAAVEAAGGAGAGGEQASDATGGGGG
jgi:hypothetical protein